MCEKWASDGGYYTPTSNQIVVSKDFNFNFFFNLNSNVMKKVLSWLFKASELQVVKNPYCGYICFMETVKVEKVKKVLCVAALLLCSLIGQAQDAGSVAPEFSVKLLDGKTFNLKESMEKGEVVVINFWFAACGPCMKELKHLRPLPDEYKGKKVRFVALSIDKPSGKKVFKEFVEAKRFPYEHSYDAQSIANLFKIKSYPTNLVIKDSKIVYASTGYMEDIAEQLKAYLPK